LGELGLQGVEFDAERSDQLIAIVVLCCYRLGLNFGLRLNCDLPDGLRFQLNFRPRLGLRVGYSHADGLGRRLGGIFELRFGLRLDCYLGNGLRCRGEQQLGLRLAY
jgi:hypothetical protein